MHWLEMIIPTLLNMCLVVGGGDNQQKICIMLAKQSFSVIGTLRSTHFYPGYIPLFSQQQQQCTTPFHQRQRQQTSHSPPEYSEYKDMLCLVTSLYHRRLLWVLCRCDVILNVREYASITEYIYLSTELFVFQMEFATASRIPKYPT